MPLSAHHRHRSPEKATVLPTGGLVLTGGWRYDLHEWLVDACLFRGKGRVLRRKTIELAYLQPGDTVLDIGCGTGTLALEAQRRVGNTGHVFGIDPGIQQIACARAKAVQRHLPVDFRPGVIEQLAFPDQTFDVVLSTLMMHHLPTSLKWQGLAEIARVLKPGGRLVIADFKRRQERTGYASRFHAGGSTLDDLAALVVDAGLAQVRTEEMSPPHFSAFPGAVLVSAYKGGL